MEQIREFVVVYDEAEITAPVVAAKNEQEISNLSRRKFSFQKVRVTLLALVLVLGVGFAAVQWGVPAVRYAGAAIKLAQGDYIGARSGFVELDGFWNAEDRAAEAEKGRLYTEACELLEQGDRDGAKVRLTQIAGFQNADVLIREIENAILYERAEKSAVRKDYLAAYEDYAAAGDFRDAQQKAEECYALYVEKETQRAYQEGCRLYARGRLTDAYRVLSSMPDPDYGNAAAILTEIFETAVRLAEKYADTGERGRTIAFLRLVEEIDPEKGAALREKLIPEEGALIPDESFYIFDLTHISILTYNTTREQLASVVLYMVMYGEMNFGLTAHKEVDRISMVDRALQACDLVGEIIPGHGSIYNPSVYVGDNYVNFRLNVEQEYSEFQRNQHIKTFKEFCVNSVTELAEAGLLSESMSRRQKAEVIMNWVGFYLTYDKSLTTHDVGVAVESKRGVCEAYAALYNRMCNLIGIPTYGQIGVAGGSDNARHIWSFHVDEEGKVFYADATWADAYELDFGVESMGEPTVELFLKYYLERCMDNAMMEEQGGKMTQTFQSTLVCSETLWLTHVAERTAEEIIAYHNSVTGKNK